MRHLLCFHLNECDAHEQPREECIQRCKQKKLIEFNDPPVSMIINATNVFFDSVFTVSLETIHKTTAKNNRAMLAAASSPS